MEPVHECQSPLFLAVEVGPSDAGHDQVVHLFFDAPPEAPTTRGFAGILHDRARRAARRRGAGRPRRRPVRLGLAEAVSPLRLRGMAAMLARIKRQVRVKSAA